MYNLSNEYEGERDELRDLETVSSDAIFDEKSENFRRALSKQLLDAVWTFGRDFQEQVETRLGALEAWERYQPRDTTEALLVAQIVAMHNATMAQLHRAALETLPEDARERAFNQVTKLAMICARQIAAFDAHRGKGQQKITVERVTVVEAGGQAIVGNVATPALASPASTVPTPTTIDGAAMSRNVRVRSRATRAND